MLASKKSMIMWPVGALLLAVVLWVLVPILHRTLEAQERGKAPLRSPTPEEELKGGLYSPNSPNMFYKSFDPVNGKGGEDITGPYEPVIGWPKLIHPQPGPNEGWMPGSTAASVAWESADRVIVVHRGEVPMREEPRVFGFPIFKELRFAGRDRPGGRWEHVFVVYDRDGNLVESYEQWNSLLKGPNRVHVSPYDPNHIWIADQSLDKIFKFTKDGKQLVQTLGEDDFGEEGRLGSQELHFLPNGEFYVIGNDRIIKMSKDGKLLATYGKLGKGPGEFHSMHGMQIDPKTGRIYVADRGNRRIQVFDKDFKFIEEWPNIQAIYSMRLSKDGFIWVGDGFTHKFLKYDRNGRLLLSWGTFGIAPGTIWGPHHTDTDPEGNVYVSMDYSCGIQKWRPKPGVDPKDPRLIGQLYP